MTSQRLFIGLASTVALATVSLGIASPAHAATTVAVASPYVQQGKLLTVSVNSSQKSAKCSLTMIGVARTKLGTVTLLNGYGLKRVAAKQFMPGLYTIAVKCGKDREVRSPKFTVTPATDLERTGGDETSPSPSPSTSPATGQSNRSTFDRSDRIWVPSRAQRIVDDIAHLDDVLKALTEPKGYFSLYSSTVDLFLLKDFKDLQGYGVPTAALATKYKSALSEMVDLTTQLSAALAGKNASKSLDLYRQVRTGSDAVLAMINTGLSSTYALPTAPTWLNSSAPAPGALSASDKVAITTYATRVVEDITELDIRVATVTSSILCASVSSRARMLQPSYTQLQNLPSPPGADPGNYWARAKTLAEWAERVAVHYDYCEFR